MDKHSYAHGVWDWPTIDGTKLIFNDLIEIKKYCKNVVYEETYLCGQDDMDRAYDIKLVIKKMNKLAGDNLDLHEKIIEKEGEYDENNDYYGHDNDDTEHKVKFEIGNDFYVSFTISKIK